MLGGGLTAGREAQPRGLSRSVQKALGRNLEFQKRNGKMTAIYGTSALWPGLHHGHCPSLPGGMGSDPQMQLWEAAAVRKRGEHLKIVSTS